MRTSILSVLAAITATTPAFAADNSADFVGPRAEVMVGYENIKASVLPTNENGVAWAGAIGYDMRLANNVIAGVDLEMGDSDNSRNLSPTLHVDTGRTLYAGGRLGYAVSPATMIYTKAGYANSELRLVNSGTTIYAGEVEGIRLGGGLEQQIGSKAFVKGEYRYTNQEDTVSSHQAMAGVGIRF
ncbi:MAG: outer membrane protein [Sphingomonadaceae bacterium]